MKEAETMNRRFTTISKSIIQAGYCTPHLIFSDLSEVSTADWAPGPETEIAQLLRCGERPLGFIARPEAGFGRPLVRLWQVGDKEALAELLALARLRYRHRMLDRNGFVIQGSEPSDEDLV